MQDLNMLVERIIALHDSGGNPNQMMQSMIQRHPNVNQMGNQLQNMTQGMPLNQFYMQLAKQGGLSEKNLQGLARILGVK